MIGAIIGGFTILGALLTIAAFVTDRGIKKLIRELHKDTQEPLSKMDERAEERRREVVQILERLGGVKT